MIMDANRQVEGEGSVTEPDMSDGNLQPEDEGSVAAGFAQLAAQLQVMLEALGVELRRIGDALVSGARAAAAAADLAPRVPKFGGGTVVTIDDATMPYRVVACSTADGREPEYDVVRLIDGHRRVVVESKLRRWYVS